MSAPQSPQPYIIQVMVAPGIPYFVKTDRPYDGQLIYEGEYEEKFERLGLNEPVDLHYLVFTGEVTSRPYEKHAE